MTRDQVSRVDRSILQACFMTQLKAIFWVHIYFDFLYIFCLYIWIKMHVWDVDNNNTRNTPTQPRQTPKCLSFNRLGSISSALCWDKTISCVHKKIRQKLDKIIRDLWTDRSGSTKTLRTDKWHEYPVSPNWRSIKGFFMASKLCRFCHREIFFSRLSTEIGIFFVKTSEPSLQQLMPKLL